MNEDFSHAAKMSFVPSSEENLCSIYQEFVNFGVSEIWTIFLFKRAAESIWNAPTKLFT